MTDSQRSEQTAWTEGTPEALGAYVRHWSMTNRSPAELAAHCRRWCVLEELAIRARQAELQRRAEATTAQIATWIADRRGL